MDTNKVEEAAVDHCPKGYKDVNLGFCAGVHESAIFLGEKDDLCHDCSHGKLASEHLKKVNAAKLRDEV